MLPLRGSTPCWTSHPDAGDLERMSESQNPALTKLLMDLPVRVDVVLGEARIPVEELMALPPGDIVALDRFTHEPVDLLVSGQLVARGHLIVSEGELGITVSEIVDGRAVTA